MIRVSTRRKFCLVPTYRKCLQLTFLLWQVLVLCSSQKQRYDGTTVVRLWVNNELISVVSDRVHKHPQLDEWSRQLSADHRQTVRSNLTMDIMVHSNLTMDIMVHSNLTMDIMVQRKANEEFWEMVRQHGIKYEILIQDVQRLANSQKARAHRKRRSARAMLSDEEENLESIIGTYPRFQEISDWLYRVAQSKPHLASVIDIGASTEARQLRVLKISSATADQRRPSIWLDAAVHAREWIGPATALYIINQLVQNYGTDDHITHLVDTYDWYFLPVANPDGYEYSHTHNRLWRKTRSRYGRSVGVDLNRNFNFHWENCSDFTEGWLRRDMSVERIISCIDNFPAYDVYAGPHPLSEPESAAMAQFLTDRRINFVFYFSLHAYAQFWLVPWAYSHKLADDFVEMMLLAEIGTTALEQKYGTGYIRGPPAIILYQAGGTTMDWAKGVAGIKYSYIIELRDTGRFGFLLPVSEIVPTASETLSGIGAVVNALTDPRQRAVIDAHARGKRKVQTMLRYRHYLERHLSHWGGVNRSYIINDSSSDSYPDYSSTDDYDDYKMEENERSWMNLTAP